MAEQEHEYDQYAPQTSGRLFSSAMFGFSKEEVLEYLDELADENFQRQEAAERRIQELTRKIQSLEALAASNAQQPQANKNNDAANAKLKETYAKLEQLKHENEIAKAATQQSEEELFDLKDQLYTAQQENSWLREEYQKSDRQIAELRRQLDAASSGQWTDADEQISELRRQLSETNEALDEVHQALDEANQALDENNKILNETTQALEEANQALDEANQDLDEANQALDDMEAQQNNVVYHESYAERAASVIIAEANAEAERIRAEAYAERERMQRQILSSAGGLSQSITTLREDVSGVEGDVSVVLESVQNALADVLSALARTELNLASFGVQAERFPASAPAITKQPQQVVMFQPSEPLSAEHIQTGRLAATPPAPVYQPSQPQSYSGGSFRRVWPEADQNGKGKDNTRPFRPTFSSSPASQGIYLSSGAEAYQQQQEEDANTERLRNLTETLVETLKQMLN